MNCKIKTIDGVQILFVLERRLESFLSAYIDCIVFCTSWWLELVLTRWLINFHTLVELADIITACCRSSKAKVVLLYVLLLAVCVWLDLCHVQVPINHYIPASLGTVITWWLRDLDGLEVSLCYRDILIEGTFCIYAVQVGLFSKFVIIKYHGLGYKTSSLLAES